MFAGKNAEGAALQLNLKPLLQYGIHALCLQGDVGFVPGVFE